jgi:RIO kinase 1
MSGKEAAVYLVETRGELRVAKVYKEQTNRSFQNRADYTEGRRVRNSRQQRAMQKRSRYGKTEIEAAWRSAEVDAIYKLQAAGVSVPEPFDFVDGVLVMELVKGWDGGPAPRLVDVEFTREQANALMQVLLQETVKMLHAGVVHGDLSDFNVLITPEKPVIIDFPQWVDPAHNRNARKLLIRDVENLTQFLARFDPSLNRFRFGPELWELYEGGKLKADTKLSGSWKASTRRADVRRVVDEIHAAEDEHNRKTRRVVEPEPASGPSRGRGRGRGRAGSGSASQGGSAPAEGRPRRAGSPGSAHGDDGDRPPSRRSRRARRQSAADQFFEGLEWRGADEAKKGPAARARQADEDPAPPSRRRRRRRRKPKGSGGGASSRD